MFGKVMKQELRANSLLYGVASAIALLFAFATVMNRTRGTDVSYLVKAPLLITGCTVAIVVLVMLFLIHTALRYQKSMYGNEGYLTFSLPVSSVELVTGNTQRLPFGASSSVCFARCCVFLYSMELLHPLVQNCSGQKWEKSGQWMVSAVLWSSLPFL